METHPPNMLAPPQPKKPRPSVPNANGEYMVDQPIYGTMQHNPHMQPGPGIAVNAAGAPGRVGMNPGVYHTAGAGQYSTNVPQQYAANHSSHPQISAPMYRSTDMYGRPMVPGSSPGNMSAAYDTRSDPMYNQMYVRRPPGYSGSMYQPANAVVPHPRADGYPQSGDNMHSATQFVYSHSQMLPNSMSYSIATSGDPTPTQPTLQSSSGQQAAPANAGSQTATGPPGTAPPGSVYSLPPSSHLPPAGGPVSSGVHNSVVDNSWSAMGQPGSTPSSAASTSASTGASNSSEVPSSLANSVLSSSVAAEGINMANQTVPSSSVPSTAPPPGSVPQRTPQQVTSQGASPLPVNQVKSAANITGQPMQPMGGAPQQAPPTAAASATDEGFPPQGTQQQPQFQRLQDSSMLRNDGEMGVLQGNGGIPPRTGIDDRLPPSSSSNPPLPGGGGGGSSSVSPDEEKTKLIQQQLVLLLHAHKCLQRERESESYRCSLPHCQVMKEVFRHIMQCTKTRDCSYPHCASSRQIIQHWNSCGRQDCSICMPVKWVIKPPGPIAACLTALGTSRKDNKFAAKKLPTTQLGTHLEKRVNHFLQSSGSGAGEVTIRVVSSSNKTFKTKLGMREKYAGKFPLEIPYRTKAMFAFEEIDGVDVCFFGMYVQEYSSDCPKPNTRRVYISYLDSVHFFQPKEYRTLVYHEIIIGYMEFVKKQGFSTAHIWACPPSEGDDCIFYCHPMEQKVPKHKRLVEWYRTMLERGKDQGVVHSYMDLYDYCQKEKLTSPEQLPYFEGDDWPRMYEKLDQELEEERKVEAVIKHREEFFVVQLHDPNLVLTDATDDPDPLLSCDLMESREAFLARAWKKHWEFSSLRRAKYSTLAMLVTLHTQGGEQFLYTCNMCQQPVETRYHCSECEDFDLCVCCYEKNGHEHSMTRLGMDLGIHDEGAGPKDPKEALNQTIQRFIQVLVHAAQCKDRLCKSPSCAKMKRIMHHIRRCKQCVVCKQFLNLCLQHAKTCKCKSSNCPVPLCANIKKHLQEKQRQTSIQERRFAARRVLAMRSAMVTPSSSSASSSNASSNAAAAVQSSTPSIPTRQQPSTSHQTPSVGKPPEREQIMNIWKNPQQAMDAIAQLTSSPTPEDACHDVSPSQEAGQTTEAEVDEL